LKYINKSIKKSLICLLCVLAFSLNSNGRTLAATVKLNYSSVTLEVGSTKTLSVVGSKSKVSWLSSKKSVATVSSAGKVTAKAVGTATIYASVAGKKLSAKVTVKKPIKLNYTSVTLEKGATKTLKVTGTSSKVTWSSSKNSVATVSSTGKVTAKAVGTATIYASVAGKKLSAKVTVKEPMKLNYTSVTLEKGATKTLKVTGTSSKVAWSSSKNSVATVSSAGKVTAKAVGTATIYASVAGKKLSAKVTVKEPIKLNYTSVTLEKGAAKTLKVTGTSSKVAWSSSNKSVATVSSAGKVTAKAVGTATIYAAVDGKKLSAKVTVKAVEAPKPSPTSAPAATGNTSPEKTAQSMPQEASDTVNGSKIVAYYAAWSRYSNFTPDKIDANKINYINYAFANIGNALTIELGYPDIDEANIRQLNQLKNINPKLKTIIAVGGWSWSGRFSDVALTQKSREKFADSVVDFLVKYNFDGVDIDWEYPVSGGESTNSHRPEDKTNFTLLMKTLREKLDEQGASDGKKYILSFAGAAGGWYANNTELNKLSSYVDYANVMTYDIHGTWDKYTDFHAPLYNISTVNGAYSVDKAITAWVNAGFPKEKIVMGVPFYGYIYKGVADTDNGFNQTYSGGASISFANIAANYLKQPEYKRYFNQTAKVPWLFNGSTFITYEDEESMAEKAKYIKEKGLSGAMIWELSQDPDRVLFNALYKALK